MKNIGIIGCGWLGIRLAKHLYPDYKIFTTTTSESKTSDLISMGFEATVINFSADEFHGNEKWLPLENLDSIIITVPFSKRGELSSSIERFKNICEFIEGYQSQLFLMSSIGIYPQTETSIREDTFKDESLETNLIHIENLVKDCFSQVNILRLGGLMGADRVFSKYNVQLTEQVVNHVHYEDICLIVGQMILKNYSSKIYNVVAPLHPSKQEVFNFQKGIPIPAINDQKPQGRKILSNLLIDELNFEFTNPDPRTFF